MDYTLTPAPPCSPRAPPKRRCCPAFATSGQDCLLPSRQTQSAPLPELRTHSLLQAAKAAGEAPYPHKFQVSHQLPAFVEHYHDAMEAGQQHSDEVSVAGRVYEKRALGGKLLFYELRSDGARVQIMADMRSAWSELHSCPVTVPHKEHNLWG